MDVHGKHGVKPKMQQAAPKSPSSPPPADDKRKNLAFCDIDIMNAYHERKRHRKKHTTKDASKSSRGEAKKLEKSELSQKIEDLTARNEQIKQLLITTASARDVDTPSKTHDDGRSEKKKSQHREREHKSRRSSHQATKELISQSSSRKKDSKEKSDLPEVTSEKTKAEESERPRHRSRKERSFTQSEPVGNKIPESTKNQNKITLRLRNNSIMKDYQKDSKEVSRDMKQIHRESVDSNNEVKLVADSKSQLIKVVNYPSKSVRDANKHDIITVYENDNIMEETDSIMSKEESNKNTSKSKTFTLNSFTHDTSSKYDTILEQHEKPVRGPKPSHKGARKDTEDVESPEMETITRKELSFSNLNLKPNIYQYISPAKMATTQTSVSRIYSPGYGTLGIGVHSSLLTDPPILKPVKGPKIKEQELVLTPTALRDISVVNELEQQRQKYNGTIKSKIYANSTYQSDDCSKLPLTTDLSQNTKFHKKRCDNKDRIVEVASKTCRNQKVTFTVEGVEPVKRMQTGHESNRSVKMETVFNMQIFPGMTISQENQQDLELPMHGYQSRPPRPKHMNESVDNFDSSGVFYSFEKTFSECKPKIKESSDVSYKFKKRYWSSKEIPKVPKPKEKKKTKTKSKTKAMKLDMGVQTHFEDSEAHERIDRDVGVSTGPCYSQEVQVQVALPVVVKQQLAQSPVPSSTFSKVQSESNISMYKEKYIRKTDFPEYKEVKPKVVTKIPVRVSKSPVKSTSGESDSPPAPIAKPVPVRKHRYQRSRKISKPQNTIREKDPSNKCHSVMSTGSIRDVPEYVKKTRSKSLTLNRDSLAEKVNINKETIKHHHQEIAAIEKCLNEILHRLGRKGSSSQVVIPEDDSSRDVGPSLDSVKRNPPSGDIESNFFDYHQEGRIFKPRTAIKKPTVSTYKSKSKTKTILSMSKFQRAKAYNEKIRKKQKKPKEHRNKFSSPTYICPPKVRSVYKNSKGFISSATSLSSKISDLGSSSPCPHSIPSLNLGYSAHMKLSSSSENARKCAKYRKHGIIKKKHKLFPKESTFSRKKSRSIYDLLKHYINLVNDGYAIERGFKPKNADFVLTPDESEVVVFPESLSRLQSIMAPKRNEPFFMRKALAPPRQPVKTTTPKKAKKVETSEDSLESNVKPPDKPDLCPLTAIFNFEPPKRDYFVYNMEVVSPKPKIVKPSQSQSPRNVSPPRPDITTGSKLMTILEENPLPVWDVPPQLEARPIAGKSNIPLENRSSNLSPVLSRRAYSTYEDCMKSLEKINPEKGKSRLTSFNCNERECSNLIFNYKSKKDAKEPRIVLNPESKTPSSAYHTLTTIMDSRSESFQSASESDTALNMKYESGYESTHKKKSIKKFFKNNLLDVFKTRAKKKTSKLLLNHAPNNDTSQSAMTNMSPEMISEASLNKSIEEPEVIDDKSIEEPDVIDDKSIEPGQSFETPEATFAQPSKTVLWFNFRKKKRDADQGCDPWCANRTDQTDGVPFKCAGVCTKRSTKCITTNTWRNLGGLLKSECPCDMPYDKQKEQCHKYAHKVLEASKQEKGYLRQYKDFEEMPLKVLMDAKKCVCKDMLQSCTKTYANKTAGIQAKQPVVQEAVQVPRDPSAPKMPRHVSVVEEEHLPTPRRTMSSVVPMDPGVASEEFALDIEDDEGNKEVVSGGLRSYTDKEIFDRLLGDYERRDALADRLSADEVFVKDMYEAANSGVVPDLQVQEPRKPSSTEDRLRDPRFSDRPRPLMNVVDTTVRPDDIGTCFARGFRPDNLMLSGDACFHINKQDKVKMSPYMLKSTESIIDFSERETPLDFLLALGFMVDEASNALKDDDIRSRLLAAITEARVWINKITTTQGTLLYLVAYKARPETMRYFLQLVEAIINKRITNAIRLDGFLRVLEDVEAGRVQMINILGEDKFEDEENEEKIVKKQLKNLFITVYNVAEKEAGVSGRSLNQSQISLLRILVAKYRAGLHPHLELIARYIGQGLLGNEIQLEAAMIFLSRLDTTEVKLKEFENYCGIACQLQDV